MEFISYTDPLASKINQSCSELYKILLNLDIDKVNIPNEYKDYVLKCHLSRPEFTLRTSALLLYKAIKLSGKPLEEIGLLDYGAGVSTLYLLAKKIGVNKVFYNDLSLSFVDVAKKLDEIFEIHMDDYIPGDSKDCFQYAKNKDYPINIIVSRNVIEHIYNLKNYFADIHSHYPSALVYNSTTANWNNPLIHIQHVYNHWKYWKIVREEKKEYVRKISNSNVIKDLDIFINSTRAIGGIEFREAVKQFLNTNKIIPYRRNYTNIAGLEATWSENLLPHNTYKEMSQFYNIEINPGIWDIHYKLFFINWITKILNQLIQITPRWLGNILAPYIFVVARPVK